MAYLAELCDELFDPAAPGRDPYRIYDQLRATKPVCWDDRRQLWVLTCHADVVAAIRDPTSWSSDPKHQPGVVKVRPRRAAPRVLSFMDPPEHTRLRRQVTQGFSASAVSALRPQVERAVHRLLDDLDKQAHPVDLISALAHPVPVQLICDLLGVPEVDRHQFDERLTELAWLFELDPTAEARKRMTEVTLRLRSYFSRLLSQDHKDSSSDGLLSALSRLDGAGGPMGQGEIVTTAVLFFVAGHVTSMNLIGNGLLALLTHRSELDRLRRRPDLLKSAVEELLRFDGPVQMVFRVARNRVEVGGVRIDQGQRVALMLGAANRDPARFANPERLDIGRRNAQHLALGTGMHHCIGAALARVELEVVISAMAERFPGSEVVDERLSWQETVTNRGLQRLTVLLRT